METEVAPVLHPNLMMVAGQWGMFDRESEVVRPITVRLKYLERKKLGWQIFGGLIRKFHMLVVKPDWDRVLADLKTLRHE